MKEKKETDEDERNLKEIKRKKNRKREFLKKDRNQAKCTKTKL